MSGIKKDEPAGAERLNKAEARETLAGLLARGMPEAEARAFVMARAGDTYVIKGGQSVVWGVADTSALGTILNISKDVSAEHELLYNQQGAVNGVVVYDKATVVKMTIVALSTATMPEVGTAMTVSGVAGIILTTTDASDFKGLKKFDISVNTWTNFSVGT